MEVLTYVPSNVVLLISGYPITGWNSIKIVRNAPSFKQIRGIRGKNTRVKLEDTSSVLTIETPQTELVNEVLSKCIEADENTGNVRLELTLKDITGTSFFTSTTGYIVARPDITYTGTLSSNTWTIACDECQLFVGSAKSAAVGIVENGISRLKDFVNSF